MNTVYIITTVHYIYIHIHYIIYHIPVSDTVKKSKVLPSLLSKNIILFTFCMMISQLNTLRGAAISCASIASVVYISPVYIVVYSI